VSCLSANKLIRKNSNYRPRNLVRLTNFKKSSQFHTTYILCSDVKPLSLAHSYSYSRVLLRRDLQLLSRAICHVIDSGSLNDYFIGLLFFSVQKREKSRSLSVYFVCFNQVSSVPKKNTGIKYNQCWLYI